jgi:hypothetical protein
MHELFDVAHVKVCLGSSEYFGESRVECHSGEDFAEAEIDETGMCNGYCRSCVR